MATSGEPGWYCQVTVAADVGPQLHGRLKTLRSREAGMVLDREDQLAVEGPVVVVLQLEIEADRLAAREEVIGAGWFDRRDLDLVDPAAVPGNAQMGLGLAGPHVAIAGDDHVGRPQLAHPGNMDIQRRIDADGGLFPGPRGGHRPAVGQGRHLAVGSSPSG